MNTPSRVRHDTTEIPQHIYPEVRVPNDHAVPLFAVPSLMSTIKQTHSTKPSYHESLKSLGVLEIHVIRAFFAHRADSDHLLSAKSLHLALGHKHHYFPHLEEMIADTAASVVHLPAGRVDEGTLITYLLEKQRSVPSVDVTVEGELNVFITIPEFLAKSETLGDRFSEIHGKSVISSDARFIVSNNRELVMFARPRFFRDWVALIRILEADPLEELAIPLVHEKQVFLFNKHEHFVPAKPELFQLPPRHAKPRHIPSVEAERVRQTLIKNSEIQDEGIHFLKRLRGKIARDDEMARADAWQLPEKPRKRDGRAKPSYPSLADLPYDEGAQIDHTKLLEKEVSTSWQRTNGQVRELNAIRIAAAADNLSASSEYSDPAPFDFRPDLPQRDRPHGRRVYETQVKARRDPRDKISALPHIGQEELNRAAFLQERDNERQLRNFKRNLPKSEMYNGHVVSQSLHESSASALLVMPRTSAGLNLFTRGLNAQQLDKRIPLASLCRVSYLPGFLFR